ncbi:hypothetical protein [Methylobacterium trifolii]|nr:hypothetical protein [Methylobacterium trifolii]
MRFFIDFDNGDLIRGWIVPDNPLAISRVVVAVDGRRMAEIPAAIVDEAFKRNGWHSTGQCTFELTDGTVPGLSDLRRLELYDADTNVMIYRRVPRDGLVMQRVLLLNTGIHPETVIQGTLFRHFQQSYFGLHRMSDEILTSIFASQAMPSSLLSGSIVVPRYESLFTPDLMLTTILLHDPHVEMATRMLWLRARAQAAADPARSWRVGRHAESALFAEDCDFTDVKSLKRFFKMLPEAAYHLLYNPLTRQLGTRLPDDRVHPGNSIVAIEILARVGIVGHRDYFEAFVSTLLDRLGIDEAVPAPTPIPSEALALAERLRSVKAVADMLVFDIAMSDAVRGSVAKGWAN